MQLKYTVLAAALSASVAADFVIYTIPIPRLDGDVRPSHPSKLPTASLTPNPDRLRPRLLLLRRRIARRRPHKIRPDLTGRASHLRQLRAPELRLDRQHQRAPAGHRDRQVRALQHDAVVVLCAAERPQELL